MIKELYTVRSKQMSINIVNTKIDSIRKKDITKIGYRVYENGYIGIAGGIGDVDMEELEAQAIHNLELKIPYEEQITARKCEDVDYREGELDELKFIEDAETLLKMLQEKYPKYIFTNKINAEEKYVSLNNSLETNLSFRDRVIDIMLVVRELDSVNIMDTAVELATRTLDIEQVMKEVETVLGCYSTVVDLPEVEKMPVIIHQRGHLEGKFGQELSGEGMGEGSSLFKDFIGQQKFHPDFTMGECATANNYGMPFFDAEGTVREGYTYNFIENGVIVAPYTDKKTARKYGYALTGNSIGNYDDMPRLGVTGSYIKPTGKTLKELLNGDIAIMVVMAEGGDCTPEGNFATPVQHAMLTDGEKMLGRLPLINISSSIYDMFGKDYRGCTEDKPLSNMHYVVADMKVSLA